MTTQPHEFNESDGTFDAPVTDDELAFAALAELTESTDEFDTRGLRLVSASIVDAALRARAAKPLTPLTGLTRAIDDMHALLLSIQPPDFELATPHESVRRTIGHLVGVERDVLAVLDDANTDGHGAPDVDHMASTAEAMHAADRTDAVELVQQWRNLADASVTRLGEVDSDRPVKFYRIPATAEGLCILRIYELWVHADDIRRALGRELSVPEPSRLELMSKFLLEALPLAMAFIGKSNPDATAAFNVTGAGGGSYRRPLGPSQAATDEALRMSADMPAADVSLTLDIVDLCRLATGRIAPHDITVDATGNDSLLGDVLVALAALALD